MSAFCFVTSSSGKGVEVSPQPLPGTHRSSPSRYLLPAGHSLYQCFSNLLHAHHISLPPPDVPLSFYLFLRPHQAEASRFARQWHRLGWVVLEAELCLPPGSIGPARFLHSFLGYFKALGRSSHGQCCWGHEWEEWVASVHERCCRNGRTLFCINCSPPFLSPCLGSEMLEIEGG